MEERGLSRTSGASYAMLGFAAALFTQLASYHLVYFYTDVMLIPAGAVALLFLVSHVWDAVNDQLAGFFMTNTRSKHGNSRPYLLWGAIPVGVLTVLLFFSPPLSLTAKIVYAYVIYFIWDVGVTLQTLAVNSLLPLISRDVQERTKLNSYRVIAAVVAALAVSSFSLPLVNRFGGGSLDMKIPGDLARGFPVMAALIGVINIPLLIFAFFKIREKYYVPNAEKVPLKQSLRCFSDNPHYILLFVIFLLTWLGSTFKNSSSAYYVIYVLGRPQNVMLFFFLGTAGSLVMQICMRWLVKRVPVNTAVLAGYSGCVAGLFVILLGNGNIIAALAGNVIFGIFSAIPANLIFIMLAGFVDKCNADYEQNLGAWIYATFNFGSKVGVSIAGAALSGVLAMAGYKAGQAAGANAVAGMTFNFLYAPILAYTACVALTVLYIQRFRAAAQAQP